MVFVIVNREGDMCRQSRRRLTMVPNSIALSVNGLKKDVDVGSTVNGGIGDKAMDIDPNFETVMRTYSFKYKRLSQIPIERKLILERSLEESREFDDLLLFPSSVLSK